MPAHMTARCCWAAHRPLHLSAAALSSTRGPTLSPVSLLCFTCAPSHMGNVPLRQQRQYTQGAHVVARLLVVLHVRAVAMGNVPLRQQRQYTAFGAFKSSTFTKSTTFSSFLRISKFILLPVAYARTEYDLLLFPAGLQLAALLFMVRMVDNIVVTLSQMLLNKRYVALVRVSPYILVVCMS
eukprot:CAMPEP_0202885442 /NCGR_PEP_ID=MMETSP1391-20130828/41660_1 /ASSEMBLY_ACC=CAM_ASM_000867 /TAXON_ID=1034604 /ORGANISM="Chlamydomonas leiostraca, Strain SAG 11-49" /LENGTH=181 /DNA_ID=CAMNT_0049568689 /DNA_START=540 /DNA_END=1086 /DNA_ORIENTATION=+